MSYIQKIEDWRASVSIGAVYERMLCASGADDVGAVVRDAVLSTTAGARRVYLFEATGRDESALQYVFCEPSLVELLPAYNRSYHRIDPVCDDEVDNHPPYTAERTGQTYSVPAFHGAATEDPRMSWGFSVRHYASQSAQAQDTKYQPARDPAKPGSTGPGGA